ncbi:MAG: metalloregulator ArsR/SmtB family transcription factor [Agrobacterium vaccinii]
MPTDLSCERFLAKAANLLAAMANAKRVLILEIVSKQEISVGPLAVMAGLSQSALSQHLGKLRGAKLVQTRQHAQTVFYRSDSDEVRRMLQTLYDIFGAVSPLISSVDLSEKRPASVTGPA